MNTLTADLYNSLHLVSSLVYRSQIRIDVLTVDFDQELDYVVKQVRDPPPVFRVLNSDFT